MPFCIIDTYLMQMFFLLYWRNESPAGPNTPQTPPKEKRQNYETTSL
jgi:hypothetical protein